MKHLVDLDEEALAIAKRGLGTSTIKATVNTALRLATGSASRDEDMGAALDTLGDVNFDDRSDAWR